MPTFIYTALDQQRKERRGSIQSTDSRAAIAALRQQSLFVVEIEEGKAGSEKSGKGLSKEVDLSFISEWRSVPTQEMIFLFKQLTFTLRAGLPVLQSLELASTQVTSARLKKIIGQMVEDLENGMQLSQAMAKHPIVFPKLVVNLIAAGENTGELELVMDRIAEHIEKKAALKMQTITGMIYPSAVILIAIGVFIFLNVKIIPAFAKFFAGKGRGLPASTQLLFDMSKFIVDYGLFLLGGLLLLIVALILLNRTPRGKLKLHDLVLRLPVIGKVLTNSIMSQLNWSLGMMLKSGLTILDSLRIASQIIGNKVVSGKLAAASEQILAGKDLSSSLQHPRIPSIVTQMVAVGERTGTLDNVMQQLGEYYEQRLQNSIKRLSAMLEPALILIIGAMVGFVYYAFMQALFSLAKV